MTYNARLIHRAAVYRPAIVRQADGERKPVFPDVPVGGMESVPCLLAPGATRTVQTLFGRDAKLDAVIYFSGGTDIRPKLASADGLNDRITVVDQQGTSLGTWLVDSTRDPAAVGAMLVVGATHVVR